MKLKFFLLTITSFLGIMPVVYSQTAKPKILVAYFSYSGNTKILAKQIHKNTGGDIFEIQPVNAYPQKYDIVVSQAKKEINSEFKPALKDKISNIEKYDIIFIGSPCWWSTIAPPVSTFLTDYDFSGKTIIPFMTHEGSRMGHSEKDIKKLCPKATVLKGLPIRGGQVNQANKDVVKWLKEIEIIQ